ncbi:ribonuclease H2 subunit C isoform X2 [Orussus abietinus]|uniref:ribonuclease H2 subunit C isoform X2 n=1 Tax=Orussus abietinus TaxID=222816 RepID=UPI00062529A2|nr:ribonuclease H2 subunit C isoform X2 [Orussus abietinus]
MAVHLHIKSEFIEGEKESVLHLMPCKINGDEAAKVSSYFTPYIRNDGDDYFSASFRGYPLQGKKVVVPEGYKGITFYERKKPECEGKERHLYCTGSFSQFTYWNYDKIPSKNDALAGALDWIDIAEALHSTIDDTDVK